MQPERDHTREVEQARQALAVAEESYRRTLADYKERIRAKRAWVAECRRRLAALGKANKSKTEEAS